jgi:hypothetical protein
MKLVKSWLPVLNVCRDIVQPMHFHKSSNCEELEESFLQIISTLPVAEAQELVQQLESAGPVLASLFLYIVISVVSNDCSGDRTCQK